jgi:hypothetical protein
MALLVLSAILFAFSPVGTLRAEPPNVAVFYDPGNPENSVGIIGEEIYEAGDLYQHYRVLSFEPEAIVLEDLETRDSIKLFNEENEDLNPELKKKARHLFVVTQMKKIYEAQIQYFHDLDEGYAADLETLILKGYVPDGFTEAEKQGYIFRILEAKQESGKEPTFQAVAEPGGTLKPDFYFYTNELGDIHYGETLESALWGPAWDYREHPVRGISRYIGVEE